MNLPDAQNLRLNIDSVRALRVAGRAAEAQAMITRLAALPDPGIWIGQLGIDLNYLGMRELAEHCLRIALTHDMSPLVRYQLTEELAMVLYSSGKYHEAHALHRINRDVGRGESLLHVLFSGDMPWIDLARPKLLGIDEPVAGKSILISIEGGFGDFVLYSRYVDALLREGARELVIEVFDEWRDVVRPREGVRLVIPTAEQRAHEMQHCDRITYVFNLFARYQYSPYFPMENPGGMIACNPNRGLPHEALASMQREPKRMKVGIGWRSASNVRHEPYRSMQLQQLAALFANPDCRFYSLQVGALTDDERALMQAHDVIDMAPYLADFGDTAYVLDEFDLFITIDSGPAHLAGALNRPVWVLLANACDCRWYDCQRFTPWYPSMRLYRQTQLGDWSHPLDELQADLAQLAAR
jgi:hypothetical protein